MHIDTDEAKEVIYWIKGIYDSHMKESRGKKHDYLGMDLDFLVDGEVRVNIMNYLKKIVSEFTETTQGRVATP